VLEESGSVNHTALACGYDSTSAFIAACNGLFGHTPGDLFKQALVRHERCFNPAQGHASCHTNL
jgi:AraC-like DNA-binding protein